MEPDEIAIDITFENGETRPLQFKPWEYTAFRTDLPQNWHQSPAFFPTLAKVYGFRQQATAHKQELVLSPGTGSEGEEEVSQTNLENKTTLHRKDDTPGDIPSEKVDGANDPSEGQRSAPGISVSIEMFIMSAIHDDYTLWEFRRQMDHIADEKRFAHEDHVRLKDFRHALAKIYERNPSDYRTTNKSPIERSNQTDDLAEPESNPSLRSVLDLCYNPYWHDLCRRLCAAIIGALFLILPMYIMAVNPSIDKNLLTANIFICLVAMGSACFLTSVQEVLMVTAAYAAVLVVFVGLNTNNTTT